MKTNNKFCAHFCNNMHNELIEFLKSVNIFENFAILEFHTGINLDIVGQMRSLVTLSDEDVRNKFNILLTNDSKSDLEILKFGNDDKLVSRTILSEPEFTEAAKYNFDYSVNDPMMNVFTYIVKFKSIQIIYGQS